jgi:hypothetical protein
VNNGPELAWILSRIPEGTVRDGLVEAVGGNRSVVSVAGQIESLGADTGGLTLFVECGDASSAQALKAGIEKVGAGAGEDGALSDVTAALQEDKVVTVSAVIRGFPNKAVALFRYLDARGQSAVTPAPAPTPPSP